MGLVRHATTVGGWTMVSRVVGFARDALIAATLAAGPVADAFFVALRLPNMFRSLAAEGAFSAAFVPLFSRRLESEGRRAALRFAEDVLAIMLAVMFAALILAELAMPWLVSAIAPGFADDPDRFRLSVEFSRLTFPYLLCMAVVALLGSVLNALDRFAAAAAAPILMNLVMIAAIAFFGQALETVGHALSWAVAAAGVVQLVWLNHCAARAGVSLRLPVPRLTPGVRRLFVLMVPGILGAGVQQLNLFVSTIIASFRDGAVSTLYYADRINQLPLAVIGVAVGVALLPLLSRQIKAGDFAGAAESQNRAIEFTALLTLPAMAALIAIPLPIVAVLFEHGRFGHEESRATAAVLAAFAAGLPAYVLVKVLLPAFYARQDIATPVRIAVVALIANAILSIVLVWPFGTVGIAIATAASSWFNAAGLAFILRRRGHFTADSRLKARTARIAAAAALTGCALYAAAVALSVALAGPLWLQALALSALVFGGGTFYAVLALAFGGTRLGELRAMRARKG
ncbi:MAG: murein biosynthesis integral membrane protein MurJ [Alphaproteobacteria bacterium]